MVKDAPERKCEGVEDEVKCSMGRGVVFFMITPAVVWGG